jgi:precorrin-2 dehydrogenase/sirohydrochlorin ferrochelatase
VRFNFCSVGDTISDMPGQEQTETQRPAPYPVTLEIGGALCVVVGGGNVGTRKAQALHQSGAWVRVVDPNPDAPAFAFAHPDGRAATSFVPEYLDKAFLVIVATNNHRVNAEVVRAALARNVLINLAAPINEDVGNDKEGQIANQFATMAMVRRGDLAIAVTTGGAGPALSARIKKELETAYPAEWAEFAALLGWARHKAKLQISDPERRAKALRSLANRDDLREMLKAGDTKRAEAEVLSCLS